MKLLVTGGAGYVGSVVTAQLLEAGHDVVVLDDCSTGHADAVPDGARLIVDTLRDGAEAVLTSDSFDAVLHFAAKSVTGESVERPGFYWEQNLGQSLALFDAMRRAEVRRVVFSSTAATYGNPERTPITESDPTRPVSPYGATKLAIDTALASYADLHGFGAVSLRYFNVAGAYAGRGERHEPETHLIANVLAVAAGRTPEVKIYGTDYPTPDGTCLRDYIHVGDLARAHLLALDACMAGRHRVFNLGRGSGHSVLDVVKACRDVTGHPIPVSFAEPRAGDPTVLVASSQKITEELGWKPEKDLHDMVADAWALIRPA
ncbi:UDP-glucose 4-epimerase GalE [Streptomyces sp. NPDC059002]|uniref:UDP-glucose 4-epimerase GalE n=1 Tax=Streptomyces sp. NPDC059002 TaxID=3346690 RepID=UPI0036A42C8C